MEPLNKLQLAYLKFATHWLQTIKFGPNKISSEPGMFTLRGADHKLICTLDPLSYVEVHFRHPKDDNKLLDFLTGEWKFLHASHQRPTELNLTLLVFACLNRATDIPSYHGSKLIPYPFEVIDAYVPKTASYQESYARHLRHIVVSPWSSFSIPERMILLNLSQLLTGEVSWDSYELQLRFFFQQVQS